MTEQIKQIAERIKEIREISGISAETLAIKLGIPNDTYLKYESGNSDIPVGIIFEISELFNIELSVMLGGDNVLMNKNLFWSLNIKPKVFCSESH